MRRWATPTGEVLVELEGLFHVLASGALDRSYVPSDSSVDDWLYSQRFRVEDGGLWRDFSGERDNGRKVAETSLELGGLVALTSDANDEAAVRVLLALRDEERAADERETTQADERRLDSFLAALPDAPAKVSFSFAYDGPDIVVRGADGVVLWRDGTWPHYGRDLFPELERVLRKKYPRRKVRFEVDVQGEEYLRFNPD